MKNHILALLILLSSAPLLTAQSGWTKAKGDGYFKLSQGIIRAGAFFNPDGEVIDITTTSVYSTGVYGEFGISDRLTALLNAPLFVRSTINNRESTVDGFVVPGDEFNGIGDIQLGLKYGLITEGFIVLAASGQLKLPTGENVGGSSELLQSGDGAWGFTGMMHASHSFYPSPFYANLSAGYQWRGTAELAYSSGTETVDYDDAFRWGGEFGWTSKDKHWQAAFKFEQVVALENGSGGGVTGGSSIFGNRISYFALTPELNYLMQNGLGFSVAVGGVAAAKNILAAPNWSLGVLWVLEK